MNISLEEVFLLLSFFENLNFWTTLFSKMVPNFWRSVWTSGKVKSKKYFHFTDFFAKIPVDSRPQNSTTEVTLFCLLLEISKNVHLKFPLLYISNIESMLFSIHCRSYQNRDYTKHLVLPYSKMYNEPPTVVCKRV